MALEPKLMRFDQEKVWNLPLNNCITYFGTLNSVGKETERARARTIRDAERYWVWAPERARARTIRDAERYWVWAPALLQSLCVYRRSFENQTCLSPPADRVLSSWSLSMNMAMMFPILLLSILQKHERYQIESVFFKDFKNLLYFTI